MGLLEEAARDQFSQNGEDGILREILRRIQPSSKWCLEVGAWDGLHLSNARRLDRDGAVPFRQQAA